MMKKLLSLSALFLCSLVAWAQTFTVDGITYNITSTTELTVEVSRGPYSGDIVIPEKVIYKEKDYSVTSIGEAAFFECSSLTSVAIPNSVTTIGQGAFACCSSLTSVTIPNSITSIGNAAFGQCTSLTCVISEIKKPELISLGLGVFDSSLDNAILYVPSGSLSNYEVISEWKDRFSIIIEIVDENDNFIYFKDNRVREICVQNWDKNGDGWLSMSEAAAITDLGKVFENKNIRTFTELQYFTRLHLIGKQAFSGCTRLTAVNIPNCVTSIGNSAFEDCDGLTAVNIPNSVTSIGNSAFEDCTRLTAVNIPNSVTSIGDRVFYRCKELSEVAIPNSVTSIGEQAFSGCRGLTSVIIPNSVTTIGSHAFSECSGLASVSIPNSVTSIGWQAFSGCGRLTSVTIPKSVTSIGGGAFEDCSGLTSIKVESGNSQYDSRNNCNAIIETASNTLVAGCKNTVIPNSVTSIGYAAFYGCSGLTAVTIPNSVTTIGNNVFSNCSGLAAVTIPNSVTSIGDYAFSGCSGLTSVTIPNSVTSIRTWAFSGCIGLTSVTIPNSVTSIGGDAFYSCRGLTSIKVESGNTVFDSRDNCNAIIITESNTLVIGCNNTVIPNTVTSIGEQAFSGCRGLTSVTIPNSVTSIGRQAFSGCSGLTSVTIPNSVTSIGEYAFSACRGLTEIYSMISEPYATKYCWNYVNKDIPLYVPVGSKSKYQATEGWNEFTNIIELDVSTDNVLAMDNLTGYMGKTVTLPILMNNEQQITGLQFDLVLPEGVTVAKKANGKNDITVTERMAEDYSLSSNTMDDGSVRVTGLSMESTPFTGNSGAIVNVVLQVDESIAEGNYQIQVKNIILSDVNGVAHKPATASCELTVKSYVPGDVDNSGDININDAVCIVNYILNKPNANFIPEAADLDGSGDININDAVVLINKYILKRANAKAMKAPRRAATGADNYLSVGAISIKPGETKTVSVDMTNTEGIQGLQCSIDLPEGLSFATKSNGKIDISNNTDRGDGFTLSSSLQDDGSLTVATVNFEGDSYYGNSGTIFTFKITANEDLAAGEYEIKVCDIVLSSGVAIKPSDATGKVTVSNSETGLQKIVSDSNQSESIYNLNGQRVNNPSRGIYIVNGRKVLVK